MKLGRYLHFKGKEYRVIGVARDCETLEELVVYQALYKSEEFGEESLWVRRKAHFLSTVLKNGMEIPRFKYIND